MAHKTLIGGTAYEIKGGKTLVNGTAYEIKGGKTLVGGTAYKIELKESCVVTVNDCYVKIGSIDGTYANATVNGQTYDSSENVSIAVHSGDSVRIKLVCNKVNFSNGGCSIYQNNELIVNHSYAEGETLEYTYIVNSDCYISLYTSTTFNIRFSYAYIFDNGYFPFKVKSISCGYAEDGMTWGEWLANGYTLSNSSTSIYEYGGDGYMLFSTGSSAGTGFLAYNGVKVKTTDKIIPLAHYATVSN